MKATVDLSDTKLDSDNKLPELTLLIGDMWVTMAMIVDKALAKAEGEEG